MSEGVDDERVPIDGPMNTNENNTDEEDGTVPCVGRTADRRQPGAGGMKSPRRKSDRLAICVEK